MVDPAKEEDIRKRILAHGAEAERFKVHTSAYAKTQPTRIFRDEEEEEGGDSGQGEG